MKFHQRCVHESKSNRERRINEWCAYPAPIIVIRLFLLPLEGDIFERTSEGKRYQFLVRSYRTIEYLPWFRKALLNLPRSINERGDEAALDT